jgi:hypothetical protein
LVWRCWWSLGGQVLWRAYGLHALRTDLDRFTFLLGGTDGEDLFGQY